MPRRALMLLTALVLALHALALLGLPDLTTRLHSPEQRARFAQGEGGALVPLMCVDKTPEELDSFATLAREAQQFEAPHQPWRLVFAAALAGRGGQAPSSADAEQPLQHMVESIKAGQFGPLLPFDRQGEPVHFK